MFADDAVLYVTANTLLKTIDILNQVIKCLNGWLKLNKLIVNTTKTKIMLFSPSIVNHENLSDVFMNDVKLEWVTRIKYFGLIIDRKIRFNLLIENLCKLVGS